MKLNRNKANWKMGNFVLRTLQRLHRLGAEAFFGALRNHRLDPAPEAPGRPPPGALAVVRHWTRRAGNKLVNTVAGGRWDLMYDWHEGVSTDFPRFKVLPSPADRFWADPFVVHREGRHHVFVEEFEYSKNRGVITCFTLDRSGRTSPSRLVLERPYHLSYPFVFEHDGQLFMIPESHEARRIDLFRCNRFPLEWEHHETLMDDIAAVDSTLFWSGEKWWLFASLFDPLDGHYGEELFLFHADGLFRSRWQPHPRNPVISDARCARPAGRIFADGGRILRPAQDGSKRYGYAVTLNEIQVLNETEYAERTVARFEPGWSRRTLGLHTLNNDGGLTFGDCVRALPKWFAGGPTLWIG